MRDFAFVFYATQWRPDLSWPLECCLRSLDTRGGDASEYARYLVYSGEATPELAEFCDRWRVTLQVERRFTDRLAWPNKALMCRIPRHEVVCILDLDLIFLADPTPMFEQVNATGHIHARMDLLIPLWPWPKLPGNLGLKLRESVGQRIWHAQYQRFGGRLPAQVPRTSGGTMPLYFNNGVNFLPGAYLERFGQAWQEIASCFLRDMAFWRPYTFFFNRYFLDQVCFALAVHREQMPWSVLPSTYNFIPTEQLSGDDLEHLDRGDIVMAHMVSPVRHWLRTGEPEDVPQHLRSLCREVRKVALGIEAETKEAKLAGAEVMG